MASGSLRRALAYPGSLAIVVSFSCMFFILGASISTSPLIYGSAIKEFHWTRSQATLGFSLGTWISAASSIFVVGPLLDKLGLRTLMIASCILCGGGMISFQLAHAHWSYDLCFVFIAMGYGAALIGAKLLVSRWYTRNLGLASGVALVGTALGGVFMPLFWTAVMTRFGWRAAETSMGAAILLIALPVYLSLARENPTEEELVPEALKVGANPQIAERMRQADLALTFGEVLKTPMFWACCIGIMLVQAVDQGMIQHTALFLKTRGLGDDAAAAGISVMFAVGLLSKLLAGGVFDRYSVRGIQIWWLFMGVVMLLAFPVQGGITLVIFAMARGVAHGGLVLEGPILAKHCFGPRLMNRVYPIMIGFLSLGSGLGAWIISAMVDHFGDYREAFILLIGLSVLAAAMLIIVKPVYRDRLRAAHIPAEGDDAPASATSGVLAGAGI